MAQRRMFSPDIVCSDEFLDMPSSSQSLYYQLGMRADDDGFVNPRGAMRLANASEDDLRILIAKRFVLPFESGVIVIKHWRINNLVRKDWYRETRYLEEKSKLFIKENGAYTDDSSKGKPARLHFVNEPSTEVRLGKVKLSISAAPKRNKKNMRTYDEERHYEEPSIDADSGDLVSPKKKSAAKYPDANKVFDLFTSPARTLWRIRPVEREAAQILFTTYGLEGIAMRLKVIAKYASEPDCPVITSPSELLSKMERMEKFLKRVHG